MPIVFVETYGSERSGIGNIGEYDTNLSEKAVHGKEVES